MEEGEQSEQRQPEDGDAAGNRLTMDLPWFLSSFLPYAFRLSLGVPGGLSSVTLCPTLLRHSLATLVHAVRIGGRMTTEHGELRKEGPYRCNLPARATRPLSSGPFATRNPAPGALLTTLPSVVGSEALRG